MLLIYTVFDGLLSCKLNLLELVAWNSFVSVILKSLGIYRAEKDADLINNILTV